MFAYRQPPFFAEGLRKPFVVVIENPDELSKYKSWRIKNKPIGRKGYIK
jgi:hypothetical protein